MTDHWPTTNLMEDFGKRTFHSLPYTCCQYDDIHSRTLDLAKKTDPESFQLYSEEGLLVEVQ